MNKNKKEVKRSCKLLTLRERIDIERQYRYGVSITSIAEEVKRNKSTISREIANKLWRGIGKYDADIAHRKGNGEVKNGCEDLRIYLSRRHKRRTKKGFRKAQRAEKEISLPSIEARPSVVDKRSRIGEDREDDIMVSRASLSCIKSVNERKSGVVFLNKEAMKTEMDYSEDTIQRKQILIIYLIKIFQGSSILSILVLEKGWAD